MARGKSPKKPTGEHNTEGAPEFKRELPVALSDDEVNKKARKQAELLDEADALKEQLAAQSSELKREIKEKQAAARQLSKEISAGAENRQVKCFERKDFRGNRVQVVRCDTGETVESREMMPEERQETFPNVEGERHRRARRRAADPAGLPDNVVPLNG